MVVACICIMLNKIVINNYLKSAVIYTRDDIRTLSTVEERTLLDAMESFNRDVGKNEYKVNNITITINGNTAVFKEKDGLNGERKIELKCTEVQVNGGRRIHLEPKVYKTDYIVP